MGNAGDRSFDIDTPNGRLSVLVSVDVLRAFAGRSHVSTDQVLDIYRFEFEETARNKARRNRGTPVVRLEGSDL